MLSLLLKGTTVARKSPPPNLEEQGQERAVQLSQATRLTTITRNKGPLHRHLISSDIFKVDYCLTLLLPQCNCKCQALAFGKDTDSVFLFSLSFFIIIIRTIR